MACLDGPWRFDEATSLFAGDIPLATLVDLYWLMLFRYFQVKVVQQLGLSPDVAACEHMRKPASAIAVQNST